MGVCLSGRVADLPCHNPRLVSRKKKRKKTNKKQEKKSPGSSQSLPLRIITLGSALCAPCEPGFLLGWSSSWPPVNIMVFLSSWEWGTGVGKPTYWCPHPLTLPKCLLALQRASFQYCTRNEICSCFFPPCSPFPFRPCALSFPGAFFMFPRHAEPPASTLFFPFLNISHSPLSGFMPLFSYKCY